MNDLDFLEEAKSKKEKEDAKKLDTKTKEEILDDQQKLKKYKIVSLATSALAVVLLITSVTFYSKSKKASEPPKITRIESRSPVLDRIENIKDAQLDNLREKMKTRNDLLTHVKGPDLQANNMALLYSLGIDQQVDATTTTNGFFKDFLSVDPLAAKEKLEVLGKKLGKNYLTRDAQNQKVYDIFNAPSLRKDIAKEIRLVGTTHNSTIATNGEQALYITLVPVTTEKDQHLGVYLTTMTIEENKIDDIRYVGQLTNATSLEDFNKAIMDQTKAMNFKYDEAALKKAEEKEEPKKEEKKEEPKKEEPKKEEPKKEEKKEEPKKEEKKEEPKKEEKKEEPKKEEKKTEPKEEEIKKKTDEPKSTAK